MGHRFLMFVGCLIPLAVSVAAISPIEGRAAVPSLPPPVDIRVELATRRVAGITSHLQEIENDLPLEPSLRGEHISPAPVLVVDAKLVRYGSIRPDVAAIVRRIALRPMGPPRFTTADELVSAAVQQCSACKGRECTYELRSFLFG